MMAEAMRAAMEEHRRGGIAAVLSAAQEGPLTEDAADSEEEEGAEVGPAKGPLTRVAAGAPPQQGGEEDGAQPSERAAGQPGAGAPPVACTGADDGASPSGGSCDALAAWGQTAPSAGVAGMPDPSASGEGCLGAGAAPGGRLLFLVAAYKIGKERAFLGAAEQLGLKARPSRGQAEAAPCCGPLQPPLHRGRTCSARPRAPTRPLPVLFPTRRQGS
jgi:hypothetical protein